MTATPWTGLGTSVSGKKGTVALRSARLDWKVTKHPMFAMMGHEKVAVPSRVVLMKDSSPLTVVSPEWEPTQNDAAMRTFEAFAEYAGMRVEYMGTAKHERVVWALVRTEWSFELPAADRSRYQSYALLSNPHEYGKSMDARYMLMNLDTMATLVLLLENGILMPTHRSRPDATSFGLIAQELRSRHDWVAETSLVLAGNPHSDVAQFYQTVFRSPRPATTAHGLLGGPTWWDAVMSVAYATDFRLGFTANTRLSSAWYGVNRAKKEKALFIAKEKCDVKKV